MKSRSDSLLRPATARDREIERRLKKMRPRTRARLLRLAYWVSSRDSKGRRT